MVINDECNLSAFSNKFVVELPDPFCDKVTIYPTLILRTIEIWSLFDVFETSRLC